MVIASVVLVLLPLVPSGLAATLRRGGSSLSAASFQKPSAEEYSFAQFTHDFERKYVAGSAEYKRRAATFQASLDRIHAVNADNKLKSSQWIAGIHPFMDWTESERVSLKGYKPNRGPRSKPRISALQLSEGTRSRLNASWGVSGSEASWEGVSLRNQGTCGSCWAISAVEAIEARLPGQPQVSAQALVDCVANPHHCGGTGGCDGATGELAYEYVRDHGLPLEASYGYNGKDNTCHADTAYPASQRVRLSGWTNLPSNKAQPLMEALYNSGPVVVAVDANEWFDYDQGIFDGCKRDATLDHAVLAKGYGGEGDAMWWRIQNSWGGRWGEQGHIRLKRRDNSAEDAYCGQDKKPSDGLGCDGGPSQVTVCGTCGLLYDPIYPEGVTLESGSGDSSPAAVPSASRIEQDEKILQSADVSAKAEAEPAVSASKDYFDFLKPDSPTDVASPATQPVPATHSAGSSNDEGNVQGLFQPDATPPMDISGDDSNLRVIPAVKATADAEKSPVDRMKDMFRQNFLQGAGSVNP